MVVLLASGSDIPQADVINGHAIYVVNGDTIDINGERVRLVGYDTPETYQAQCAYERALGDQATARLRQLVTGLARVELVLQPGRDRYAPLLGSDVCRFHGMRSNPVTGQAFEPPCEPCLGIRAVHPCFPKQGSEARCARPPTRLWAFFH
jgi:hypothetical protein